MNWKWESTSLVPGIGGYSKSEENQLLDPRPISSEMWPGDPGFTFIFYYIQYLYIKEMLDRDYIQPFFLDGKSVPPYC